MSPKINPLTMTAEDRAAVEAIRAQRAIPTAPDPCLVSLVTEKTGRRAWRAWRAARNCPEGCGTACQKQLRREAGL